MKLITFDEKKGRIKLKIDTLDDLWVLYNILSKGDHVFAKTIRRIKQDQEAARSDKGERIPVFLGIEIEEFSFHGFSDRLRIKGKIIQGPEDLVSFGSYHTLNIDLSSQLEIIKQKWSNIELKRINEAIKSTSNPNILLCAVDSGEATVAVVGDYQTKVVGRITENIPGARVSDKENAAIYKTFFSSIFNSIVTSIKTYQTNYIVIAGPGFVKDHLYEYIIDKQSDLKDKIILDSVSSGEISAINEIIKRGVASGAIAKLRVIEESKIVDEILKRLGKGKKDVTYGFDSIRRAVDVGAVELLVVTDELLRDSNLDNKTLLYNLLEDVEKIGAKVHIISVEHQSGEILKGLKGIAAILRYEVN